MYKAFQEGDESDMNDEKIRLLETLGFKWNMIEKRDGTRPRRHSRAGSASEPASEPSSDSSEHAERIEMV
jgi:hypothetical protein